MALEGPEFCLESFSYISIDIFLLKSLGSLGASACLIKFLYVQVSGGIAYRDGRLLPGDQILSVNNEDTRNATQDYAAQILKVITAVIYCALYLIICV